MAYGALARLVASQVTHVPSGALAAAAAEQALSGTRFGMAGPHDRAGVCTPLTSGGKPEVFYAGSEACPFCGVQRWGMIVALSQFGTFSNLHLMQSIATTPPQVRTFTFFGSSYRSPYISFVPVEVWSNVPKPPGLARLQSLTHPESALLHRFDPPCRDAVHRRRQPVHHGQLDGRSTAHRPQVVDAARREPWPTRATSPLRRSRVRRRC